MAKFTSSALVSETIWNMRLADLTRGTNRSLINSLVNGNPPYTEQERQDNNVEINVNFLDATQLCADARRSLYNGFQAPGKFFTVSLDSGPVHKRAEWGRVITAELQKIMKGSRIYAECLDSQFAAVVLHGMGPAVWPNQDEWVPEEKGIEDVLLPSDTLRSFRNLDYFSVFHQYTPEQLWRMTHGGRRDPAWNMDMVEAALNWAHNQTQSQLSYSDLFSPEKVEERFKQDLGFYGTDAVPTIDFWKFYFHENKGGKSGWRMRAVLDTPGENEVGSPSRSKMPRKNLIGKDQGQWLYDPGDRVYGENIEQLIHFQFGDLSAVSPFRVHSVRGLGWLLYSICHLQNRLLCKASEAVLENMMQYFRGNEQDRTRTQKVDLHHFGFVPDGLAFVRPEERWQVNSQFIESSIDRNQQRMEYSAAQYRQRQEQAGEKEKTATQVMAEVNSAMSMVGSLLTQAYRYQGYSYSEICRRFCKPNSGCADVRKFRVNTLRRGVPEKALDSNRWIIEPEKVMGGGNKTLQIAMADALLAMRQFLDPEAQRIVDRINIAAKTDNDDLANRLVPEIKSVSDSAHDAANSFGTLMLGAPVPIKSGINHPDAIEVLLTDMAAVISRIEQQGGIATMAEILGLGNVASHISQHLQILAQDKMAQPRVKKYGADLSALTDQIKEYAKRLAQQRKQMAQQSGGNGADPKEAAKVQAILMQAKVKSDNASKSHAEKTAQRRITFEQKTAQDAQKHAMEMQKKSAELRADIAAKDITTAAEVNRGRIKSTEE